MASTQTITVGRTVNGQPFHMPLDLVTETTAIIGRRGSGKTTTGVAMVEDVLQAGQQVVVMDPLDVWWGLRSTLDGTGKGYEVLLIGDARKPHTDLALGEGDGKAIADFLVDDRVSCILSMRHLSIRGMHRFAAAFTERWYDRKGDPGRNTPCLMVIDEASKLVPQRFEGDVARLVGAVESWVRQGRASGIGVMLIDQRPASVNKNVLTQAELMVTHQLVSPQDRKALVEWIRANDVEGQEADYLASLASLKRGEAWFWSPAWLQCFDRVHVRQRRTYDSSATPKVGESAARPREAARFNLDSVKAKLQASIERSEQEDPVKLRAKIADLQKQLAGRAPEVDQAALDAAELRGRHAAVQGIRPLIEMLSQHSGDIRKVAANLSESTDSLDSSLRSLNIMLDQPASSPRNTNVTPSVTPGHHARAASRRVANGSASESPGDWFRPAHQRILDALAWLNAFGIEHPSRSNVAAVAGVSPKSSSFSNDVSRLSSGGLITYPQTGSLALTELGRSHARHPEAAPTLDALHEAWRQCTALRPAHVRLMNALIEAHPKSLTREELANRVGVSARSSSFSNDVSRLSAMGLVVYPATGHAMASPLLFPQHMH